MGKSISFQRMVDWSAHKHLIPDAPGFIFNDFPTSTLVTMYKDLYQEKLIVTDKYMKKHTIQGPKLVILTMNPDTYQEFRYGSNLDPSVMKNYWFVELKHCYVNFDDDSDEE